MAHLSFETADHLWHTWAHTSNSEGPKYLNIVKRSSPGSLKKTISFKKRNGRFEEEKIDIVSNQSYDNILPLLACCTLFTCINQATMSYNVTSQIIILQIILIILVLVQTTWLFCSVKQKVSFVYHATKYLQKMLLRKTEFFCNCYFSNTKNKPVKKYRAMFFSLNRSPHAKLRRIQRKPA